MAKRKRSRKAAPSAADQAAALAGRFGQAGVKQKKAKKADTSLKGRIRALIRSRAKKKNK